jgi:hypothetical protein
MSEMPGAKDYTGKAAAVRLMKLPLPGIEETALLFHGRNKPELEFIVKSCGQDALEDILALQQRVYDGIVNKDLFVRNSRDELTESLNEDVCIGVYRNEKLVAFTLLVVNRISPHSLACQLDLDEEQCRRSVTYDTTFVDSAYKGYGLQRFLIGLKDQCARELGAEAAYTTVSPANEVSLDNILSQGFEIIGEKPMYGGYNRYILRKAFGNNWG